MTIIDELLAAGLGGRGGAGFSTATKIAAAQKYQADLIVNVCDGELGAMKDAWVVRHHLTEVVTGAELVAWPKASIRFAAHRGSRSAARLAVAGLPVLEVPKRYVSSEDSALVSLAHGGLARPMTKRQPFVLGGTDSAGRRIRPTLVLNAETVWRIAQIAENGSNWFRSFGTAAEPGPRLATVVGHVDTPKVIESEGGVLLASLLDEAGARPSEAVLLNGLGGGFLSIDEARSFRWETQALRRFGAAIGPGILDVVDPSACPVAVVAKMLRYAMGESAGQCGPCMFGLPSLSNDWERLASQPSQRTWDAVQQRLSLMSDRGACRYPDGVAGFTTSAMRVFREHLVAGCAAGGCTEVPLERTGLHAAR